MSTLSFSVEFDPQNPGIAASKLRQFAKTLDGYEGRAEKSEKEVTKKAEPVAAEPAKRGRKPKAEKEVEKDFDFGDADEFESDSEIEVEVEDAEDVDDFFNELPKKAGKAGKTAPASAPKKTKEIKDDEVRAAVVEYIENNNDDGNGRQSAVKLMKKFGATKPSEVPQEKRAAFIKACQG